MIEKNINLKIFLIIFCFIACKNVFANDIRSQNENLNTHFTANEILNKITPDEDSPLEKRLSQEKCIDGNQHFFYLHNLNYMMPYYYTSSPNHSVYNGFTPDNQRLNNSEFKGQISVGLPVFKNLLGDEKKSLDVTFTETVFWQFYAESQYFRSTDTEINTFYKYHFFRNWLFHAGLDHQSNGKGGQLERSWNRIISMLQFSGEKFFLQTEAWGLIFQSQSSDLHNSDIEKYLGHDRVILAYKVNPVTFSFSLQNIERVSEYGSFRFSVSVPMNDHLNLYMEYFNGYGQSLLEYNHLTQGAGIGVSFNSYL